MEDDKYITETKRGPGRPKGSLKPRLDDETKRELILAGSRDDPDALSVAIARANHTPCVGVLVTDAHMEIVLLDYAAGMTIAASCLRLGISAGLVRQRFQDHEHWMDRYMSARTFHAAALVDEILPVVRDPTRPAADKRLEYDALVLLAKFANRAEYGDKVAVGVRAEVVINMSKDDLDLG